MKSFDFRLLNAIQTKWKSPKLDKYMPKITFLGNNGYLFIAVAMIMLFFDSYRECGICTLTGMMLGVILGNFVVKNLVKRARPCWLNDKIEMLIDIPKDYSFPSGHTLSSFIAATVITSYDKRLGIAAIIIALAIGFSRMYLYVHFPTDIFFAIILGIAIGMGVVYFLNRYLFT